MLGLLSLEEEAALLSFEPLPESDLAPESDFESDLESDFESGFESDLEVDSELESESEELLFEA